MIYWLQIIGCYNKHWRSIIFVWQTVFVNILGNISAKTLISGERQDKRQLADWLIEYRGNALFITIKTLRIVSACYKVLWSPFTFLLLSCRKQWRIVIWWRSDWRPAATLSLSFMLITSMACRDHIWLFEVGKIRGQYWSPSIIIRVIWSSSPSVITKTDWPSSININNIENIASQVLQLLMLISILSLLNVQVDT